MVMVLTGTADAEVTVTRPWDWGRGGCGFPNPGHTRNNGGFSFLACLSSTEEDLVEIRLFQLALAGWLLTSCNAPLLNWKVLLWLEKDVPKMKFT